MKAGGAGVACRRCGTVLLSMGPRTNATWSAGAKMEPNDRGGARRGRKLADFAILTLKFTGQRVKSELDGFTTTVINSTSALSSLPHHFLRNRCVTVLPQKVLVRRFSGHGVHDVLQTGVQCAREWPPGRRLVPALGHDGPSGVGEAREAFGPGTWKRRTRDPSKSLEAERQSGKQRGCSETEQGN